MNSTLKPLLLLLLAFNSPEDTLSVDGKFLKRGDLPDDFNFPILELDFAVLRVRAQNGSQEPWTLRPDDLAVLNPKGKIMKRVSPFDVTPKIIRSKAFKRRLREFNADSGSVYRDPGGYPGGQPGGYPRSQGGVRTIDMRSGGGGTVVLSADAAVRVRSVLERHEIKETTLAPGETLEALVYLKSKKRFSELHGSTLVIGKAFKVKIP